MHAHIARTHTHTTHTHTHTHTHTRTMLCIHTFSHFYSRSPHSLSVHTDSHVPSPSSDTLPTPLAAVQLEHTDYLKREEIQDGQRVHPDNGGVDRGEVEGAWQDQPLGQEHVTKESSIGINGDTDREGEAGKMVRGGETEEETVPLDLVGRDSKVVPSPDEPRLQDGANGGRDTLPSVPSPLSPGTGTLGGDAHLPHTVLPRHTSTDTVFDTEGGVAGDSGRFTVLSAEGDRSVTDGDDVIAAPTSHYEHEATPTDTTPIEAPPTEATPTEATEPDPLTAPLLADGEAESSRVDGTDEVPQPPLPVSVEGGSVKVMSGGVCVVNVVRSLG